MKITFESVIPKPMSDSPKESDIWLNSTEFLPNTLYQIVAPSGTGKTSLVHILFGIRKDYNGVVKFDSEDISTFSLNNWSEIRRTKLSILFQGLRLFPELDLWENIRIKNKLTNYKTDEQIQSIIERLGLAAHVNKPAGILSFGQKQRVALIRALCQPFECLLLDEPFSHLDETNSRICMQIIEEEIAEQNAMAILTALELQNYSEKQNVLYL